MLGTILIATALGGALIGLVACSDSGGGASQPPPPETPATTATTATTATATVTTPLPATATPPAGSGPTGIVAVDRAIRAVVAQNAQELAAFVRFQEQACTTAQGAGGPPKCRAGEPEGTRVEVFPVASCEGFYTRRAELDQHVTRFLEGSPRLYAVYRNSQQAFLSGTYALLFSYTDPAMPGLRAKQLFVSPEGISAINFGCGQTPADMVRFQNFSEVILPPVGLEGGAR